MLEAYDEYILTCTFLDIRLSSSAMDNKDTKIFLSLQSVFSTGQISSEGPLQKKYKFIFALERPKTWFSTGMLMAKIKQVGKICCNDQEDSFLSNSLGFKLKRNSVA